MCFELDSAPPIPVISGAAVSHEDLVLTSEDGTRFAAFLATPDEATSTGVVILPDVRGLYRFYEELALRFAERGYSALAIDYFGRTAGVEKREGDWDYMPHVGETTPETVMADARAAAARLQTERTFTVGFCFGGRNSWLASAHVPGLSGAVGFYGHPGAILDHVPQMQAPVLALQAGDDARITPYWNHLFDQALSFCAVEHELVVYDGAPHSFFDRKQEEFQDASDDAWSRTLAFIA